MGNFSRDTFNRLKNYVGVRLQQGVPLVDADWNEMEDIRKDELRTLIKWFVGDGVPLGSDGFRVVMEPSGTDFTIKAGICLVGGWETINHADLKYQAQPLFKNDTLALKWGVAKIDTLTSSVPQRDDMVYLDAWEREVTPLEDNDLVDARIGIESCVRLKREWVVRVIESFSGSLPVAPAGHHYCPLALLHRVNNLVTVEDKRRTGLSLHGLVDEIADARGMKGNLGNRLDESLTRGGQLRQKVVGPEQLNGQLANTILNALPAASYDFKNRAAAEVAFSQLNADGALQTVTCGFKPRFVWAVGNCNTTLGGNLCGLTSSGHADLKSPFIQKCNGASLFRIASAPFWRQTGYTTGATDNYIFYTFFSDETQPLVLQGFLAVSVNNVSDTGLVVRLTWQGPSTTTTSLKKITSFSLNLSLLLLG
ncbi:MAG TPA: DUF6519 domain-containing protein [Geobacteraceae bacterium]